MAVNKNAQLRYNIIDRCLSNFYRRHTYYTILEEVNHALEEHGSDGIKLRQLQEDLKFMQSDAGFRIELAEGLKDGRKRVLRYANKNFSIADHPLNQMDSDQLEATIRILNRYKRRKEFSWLQAFIPRLEQAFDLVTDAGSNIISYQENVDLKGGNFLGVLFNAIVKEKVLKIEYQPYQKKPETNFLHPWHLKQYNDRWFLLGYNEGYNAISNFPLDRINSIDETGRIFRKNEIDWEDYFDDIIGVTKPEDTESEKIILRFAENRIDYVKTKPLHGVTQRMVKSDPEGRTIQIEVIPNFELYQTLLSFGGDVEVLSPEFVRDKMKEIINTMQDVYSSADRVQS